jgi:hypothetical protein
MKTNAPDVADIPAVLEAVHARRLTPEDAVQLAGPEPPESTEGEPLWLLLSRVWDRSVPADVAAEVLVGTGCWAEMATSVTGAHP